MIDADRATLVGLRVDHDRTATCAALFQETEELLLVIFLWEKTMNEHRRVRDAIIRYETFGLRDVRGKNQNSLTLRKGELCCGGFD